MTNLDELFRQARTMQERLVKAQADLRQRTVIGSSGAGMVTVTATGAQEILSVRIDPAAVAADDLPMLEDLVQAAVNDALARSRQLAKDELGELAGALNVPGLF